MAITNGYATLAQVKAALRITDSVDDPLLEMAIESGSRAIDGYANRNFYSSGSAVRVFTPSDSFVTEIDDLISLTTLKTMTDDDSTFDTTWSASDYQLEPLNGRADGLISLSKLMQIESLKEVSLTFAQTISEYDLNSLKQYLSKKL